MLVGKHLDTVPLGLWDLSSVVGGGGERGVTAIGHSLF